MKRTYKIMMDDRKSTRLSIPVSYTYIEECLRVDANSKKEALEYIAKNFPLYDVRTIRMIPLPRGEK